jgi:predicted RND superfamily exporter protein
MVWLSKLSVKYSILVILIIIVITTFFGYIISQNFDVDTDLVKDLSRDLDVVKYYQLKNKIFTSKDNIFIGIENTNGSVFTPETLRYIDGFVKKINDLKLSKTYKSIITGKEETIELNSDIDRDNIMSIIDADSVAVENGSIVTSSYTKLARKKAGLYTDSEKGMEELPDNLDDLEKFIPFLRNGLINDDNYYGTYLSKDETSCAIILPIEKTISRKKTIINSEFIYMIDKSKLEKRLKGEEYDFPHNLYGKKVNGTNVDEQFINNTTINNKVKTRKYFLSKLGFLKTEYPSFYNFINSSEVNEEYIKEIMRMIENDSIYELKNTNETYENLINTTYDFLISNMDKFSKDNLNVKVYDLINIIDVFTIYDTINKIKEENKPDYLNTYIAGQSITEAMIGNLVQTDILIFVVVAVIVIIIVLFLSFKTLRGILLPLSTVIITSIWVMGFMLLIGQKLSSVTVALPILLMAIGSAYCIHYLSKYYEDIHHFHDIKEIVTKSIKQVSVPILMAGITTIGGFASLLSAHIDSIKFLGLLSSIGVLVTIILTFSYLPAVLSLLKKPKNKIHINIEDIGDKGSILDKILNKIGSISYNRSKLLLIIVVIFTLFISIGIILIQPESSFVSNFSSDNELVISNNFINSKLTGTGELSLILMMRDRVSLSSENAKKDLINRIEGFTTSYKDFINNYPELKKYDFINNYIIEGFQNIVGNIQENQNEIEYKIKILEDIFNEEYELEEIEETKSDNIKNNINNDNTTDIDSLDDLSDDFDSLDDLSDDFDNLDDLSDDFDSLDDLSDDFDSLDDLSDDFDSLDDLSDDFSNLDDLSDDFDNLDDLSDDFDVVKSNSLSKSKIKGIENILIRMKVENENLLEQGKEFIIRIRDIKETNKGKELSGKLNYLIDFFKVDFTQPEILRKMSRLEEYLVNLKEPTTEIDNKEIKPIGNTVILSKTVKSIYKVFYHDDNDKYEKIPDVSEDGFEDKSLTDRNIIAVCLNQARSSNPEQFNYFLTDDLKNSQFLITTTGDKNEFIVQIQNILLNKTKELFPDDDPYIDRIIISGFPAVMIEMNSKLMISQILAIGIAILVVFLICSFILKSFIGGLISIAPLALCNVVYLGIMGFLGFPLTLGTLLASSVVIGAGIDYTIHFLQRYKIEHVENKLAFQKAYFNTLHTTGKAIIFNAFSVAGGFIVLSLSSFKMMNQLGILVAIAMILSSLSALTVLPALVNLIKPKFLDKK